MKGIVMIFDTRISGIPCQCQVNYYSPFKPMKIYGSGFGDAHPPEYEEFQFTILDRKGYKADWLENKLTVKDKDRLLEEFHIELTGERHGYIERF